MSPALKDMLEAYEPKTPVDYQNAAREVAQEIALLGLWRGGFFKHAAFYGGTALRIFHGLRRFSEDLDFTLMAEGDETRIEPYLTGIATELASWGFTFDAEGRSDGGRTGIESAFLKGNTQLNLLQIGAPPDLAQRLPKSQKIKIKLEMDIDPPAFAIIKECRASYNTLSGIDVDRESVVRDCLSTDNQEHGILVNHDSRVVGNTCGENTLDGIHLANGDNRVDGNHVTDNNGAGINAASAGNLIIRNTAASNDTNYTFVPDTRHGPIVNVQSVDGDISATPGSDHPWANFEF